MFIEWQNVAGHIFEPTLQNCIVGIFDKSMQYINEINTIILLVKSFMLKCKYKNVMPSPEAVGKRFSCKVSLSQVRSQVNSSKKYRFVAFVKIDVSEITQNCMLGIIEELFYDSCIISELYIYVSRVLNLCICKILTMNLL